MIVRYKLKTVKYLHFITGENHPHHAYMYLENEVTDQKVYTP